MNVSEELKQKAQDAFDNDTWKESAAELRQELRDDNPEITRSAAIRAIKNLRSQLAGMTVQGEGGQAEKEVSQESSFNTILRKSFLFNGKKLTFANLSDESLAKGKLQLLNSAPDNLGETIDQLDSYAKELNDNVLIKSVRELGLFYVERMQDKESDSNKGVVRIDFGWAEEVGDLPLGKLETRQRVYDYWADIHGKHGAVLEATENLISVAKGLVEEQEVDKDSAFQELNTAHGMVEDYLKNVDDLEKIYNMGIPNYVLQLPAFELKVPDDFHSSILLLDSFLDLKGVMDEKEEGEEKEEEVAGGGKDLPVTRDNPQDRSLPAPTRRRKQPKVFDSNKIEVDPIFYYQYEDEYKGVKIPLAQIKKVRKMLDGYEDNFGEELAGLKYLYLNDEELDEFDDWFDDYENMVTQASSKSNRFFLPISPFVEKYMDDSDYGSEGGAKIASRTSEMNEITFDFLEAINSLIEIQRTQFSTYQRKKTDDAGTIIEGLGQRTSGARAGQDTPNPITDVFGERPEKTVLELDKAWNDLLSALNEYYLLPMQGKNYVQAKERPRWATSHASLVLSIKNAKTNPLGTLLDRMVTEGVEGLKPSHMNNIGDFIEHVRTGGSRFDRKIWNKGKRAVKALDSIFGKQFHDKNMESIGYIIYDMGKKLNATSIINNPPTYWSKLEDYHSDYKKGSTTYPIEQLRHALNTPEFTAWMGLSEGREQADKKPWGHQNKKLVEAVTKLDKIFDTFHKMDEINAALLNAHDAIRKMQSSPIIYSNLSLHSIDHMDLVINKIHKEQRMDLTATEIDKIVKAVASYESIAKNYGLNEEVVYTVKAMFR